MQFLFVNSMSDRFLTSSVTHILRNLSSIRRPVFQASLLCVAHQRLFYYTTFSIVCQVFFQIFLNFSFQTLSCGLSALCSITPVRLISELIYYTTLFWICQVFFQTFFKKLLIDFCGLSFVMSSRPTALLLYHVFPILSSKRNYHIFASFCAKSQ
jgi:hypothetical protein